MTVVEAQGGAPGLPEPEDRGAGGPPGARRLPVSLLATAGVILATTSVLAWRLLGAFTFMMDDLTQFDVANRFGLSGDLLLMNVAQHFGPINRIAHLLELRVADVDPTIGALVITGLVGCLLVITAWLTYELGMSLVRRLLVLAAAGTALSVLDTAVWNDSALHILMALIASYTVIALHLRGIRTGRPVWHIGSVLVFAAGLLVQERVALILPVVVFFDVFLLWRNDPLAARVRRLWAVKWPLLAMAGLAAIAASWIHANYVAAATPGDAAGLPVLPALRTALLAFTGYQFPQLAGYQPDEPLTTAGQVIALVIILLVFALVIVMNRRNAGPVMLFVGTFAVYWGFLVFSPMVSDAVIQANAERLQNAVYVTVPGLIAVFSLEGPPRLVAALGARTSRRVSVALQAGSVCLLIIGMVVAGNVYTADHWARYRSAHQFWEGVRDAKSSWTDPAVTVIPLQAPPSVADQWALSYGRQEFLLPLIARGWAPGNLTGRTVVLTADGQQKDVALQVVSGATPAPTSGAPGSCLRPSSWTDGYEFRLDRPAVAAPLLLRIGYTSDMTGQIRAIPSSNGATPQWDWPVAVGAGTHSVVVPLPLDRVDSFRLDDLSPGSTFCIAALDVVRPVATEPDGSCWVIDQYGIKAGEQTACPQ